MKYIKSLSSYQNVTWAYLTTWIDSRNSIMIVKKKNKMKHKLFEEEKNKSIIN